MAANDGTKLHGKNGAIAITSSSGKVSLKTEWTLNLNRDYVDATVFGDTNKTYLVGLKDISGTYAGLLDNSGDLLVNATDDEDTYTYLFTDDGTGGGTVTLVAYGPALHDSAINCSNTDAVRVSGNFRASGNWTVFSTGSLTT
jgi:hypothetical protein